MREVLDEGEKVAFEKCSNLTVCFALVERSFEMTGCVIVC